jgi:hypothetical protein
MPVKAVRNKHPEKLTEFELYEESRRIPVIKRSVYRTVFVCLQKAYDAGKINEITFDEVNKEVRKYFPESKFNPFHLAHYKHKFLIEAP